MGPNQPPPTAESRGSKTENLKEGGQNESSNQNQMLVTPTPPETKDAKEETKIMGSDVKSKEEKLRLAPGSVELEPPQPIMNQRELNSARQSDNSVETIPVQPRISGRRNDDSNVAPDLENPATQQHQPSNTLLQAEVAPDMDAAIQRAVQDALRQRDEQMVVATVATNPTEGAGSQDENDEARPKNGHDGNEVNDEQRFNKMKLFTSIGIVVLAIVIVLAVTLSGGEGVDLASNDLQTNSPPLDSVMTLSPTALPDGYSGECVEAIRIDFTGYQANVTNSAVAATYENEECGVDLDDLGIWFLLEVPEEGERYNALFTVSEQDFAAKMSIYTGSSCATLQCLDRTFSSAETARTYELEVESGASYFVFVAGNGSDQIGNFQFRFQSNALDASSQPTQQPTRPTVPPPTLQPTPNPTSNPFSNPNVKFRQSMSLLFAVP